MRGSKLVDYIGMIANDPIQCDLSLFSNKNNNLGDYENGSYRFPNVILNFHHLNDSEHTLEPFHYDDDRVTFVCNGNIYNIAELKNELIESEIEFTANTDLEVLAAFFTQYKEEMFSYLRGMFSILIWDKQEEKLYGARDHFGMKQLFYLESEASLLFSTEKKAIANLIEEENVNFRALQHYLSFQYVPEPLTMTEQIRKVEPGYYFVKEPNKNLEFHRYWHATFKPVDLEKKEWIDRVQTVLYDSVSHHIGKDTDIGAFLSGGIDSTFIVSIAKQILPNIKTFSVGFSQEGYSEVDIAKLTAEELGIDNISYIISPEEYVESLPKIMWHMDDPLADPACVPLYFLARETRKHVSYALSGEGADELFGGYNIYREPDSLKVFNYVTSYGRKLASKVAATLPDGVYGKSFLERGTTPLSERYIGNAKMFEEKEKQLFFKHFNEKISYLDITKKLFNEVANEPLVHQMQYVDIHSWLRGDILVKANRMSKAHSLEVRMPFLDKDVFAVARTIPVELKIAKGTTKHVLREAARGIIPSHILDRKKLGFPVPIRHWLKNELRDWAIELIHHSNTEHIFSKSYILELLDAHCLGKADYSRKIWTVLMFMVWHQQFIEQKNVVDQNETILI